MSINTQSGNKIFLIILIAFVPYLLAFFFVFHLLNFKLVWDEPLYLADIKYMGTVPWLDFLKTYSQPSGPLYYLLVYPIYKFAAYPLFGIRVFSLILSLATISLFALCLLRTEGNPKHALIKTLLLAWNPWFFLSSFLILNDMCALFFLVLGLYLAKKCEISSSFSLLLASITRQFYVLYSFVKTVDDLIHFKGLRQLFYSALPGLGLFCLMLYWGGLTPIRSAGS